jgi:hypothetical protein
MFFLVGVIINYGPFISSRGDWTGYIPVDRLPQQHSKRGG